VDDFKLTSRCRALLCVAALGGCAAEPSAHTEPVCGPAPTAFPTPAPERVIPNPGGMSPTGSGAMQITEGIYVALGFGNTFLVTTPEGTVVIDTSNVLSAVGHREALGAVDPRSPSYIVLTHGHADHTGGVNFWESEVTRVIAHERYPEFVHYQYRVRGALDHRNASQFPDVYFGLVPPYLPADAPVENEGGNVLADTFVDDWYEFRLGGLTFQIIHAPGETSDQLAIWVPEHRALFIGDNYFGPSFAAGHPEWNESFPNLYTLRGTTTRYALDYVRTFDRLIPLRPEILLPSHGDPIYGADVIEEKLTRYRNAIAYVHDETVRGMNAGADVFTLMRTIKLPPALNVQESYGNLPISIRGIFEGYLGYFDGNPSNMFAYAPADVYGELVALAGAPAIVARAEALTAAGEHERALLLTDVLLEADPGDTDAWQVRHDALVALRGEVSNHNVNGWLVRGISEADENLP
jgi:alkyl sulfatase BDS1-like metallo-beta-lactamase superfamily hydrolase